MSFDFGALAGFGLNALTGNFLGAAVSAVGLGMSIFGGVQQSHAEEDKARIAKQQAGVSMDVARQEQGINDVKQQQMELEGRRMQLENMRNVQRARSQSLSTAVNQGAQFGTGLQGGMAQIADQGFFNEIGVDSALASGRKIAGYNSVISQDKIQMASLGGDMAEASGKSAEAQGLTSLGGTVMKAGPIVGQFSQGFGKSSSASSGFNPFNITGSLY